MKQPSLDHAEIEIKGRGTLGNFRGYKIDNSRIFSKVYRRFDATGILFEQCIFENCDPVFEQNVNTTFGCLHCKFISATR